MPFQTIQKSDYNICSYKEMSTNSPLEIRKIERKFRIYPFSIYQLIHYLFIYFFTLTARFIIYSIANAISNRTDERKALNFTFRLLPGEIFLYY